MNVKEIIVVLSGGIGTVLSALFGGFDNIISTLLLFMLLDYVTGTACGFFGKSTKSNSGALNSQAGFKGIVKKGVMLLLVIIAVRIDALLTIDYARTGVCFSLITNELISILENIGLIIGADKMPKTFTKIIDLLNKKGE